MTQWVRVLATKPDNQSLIPRPWWNKRANMGMLAHTNKCNFKTLFLSLYKNLKM